MSGVKFHMVKREGLNSTSCVHADYNDALVEATRLARANPGTKFYILESTHVVSTKEPEVSVSEIMKPKNKKQGVIK